jgi:site-specific recombinase XerD
VTDRFFDFSRTIDRMRQGPLGKHVDAFATLLVDQGFGRLTGRFQIRVVADFSRWLERRRISLPSIDASVIERYGADYRRKYALWSHRPPILQRFLGMLNEQGVAPRIECPAIKSPRQEEIEAYRLYLQQERGLSERTIPNMVAFAELFLAEQFPKDRPDFAALGPRDVTRFVERQATRVKSGTAKLMVTALRAYFRYLRHRGDIQTDLAACIPPVAPYSVSPLPSFLPTGAVEKILAHCDRSTPLGKRDYAVLLLLARIGLRNGEIIGMNLEDIDWDVGEVTIRGKGGRGSKLPLTGDVGEAIADYLRHGRPACSSRRVFLRQKAPIAGLSLYGSIRDIVRTALRRAGVESARKGPHIFRHTLGTEMLRKGASLDEIGEVLRHRSPRTTRVYAKVDLKALHRLAMPWPGGVR